MTEERLKELVRMEGPHHFVLLLRGDKIREAVSRDRWLRGSLAAIALLAALGLGTAWWAAGRSLSLELRLARAQEMNAVLREMNVAAAGLAHETRNPLNVVRAMAQTVVREPAATGEIREKAEGIIEEVDRISSRLGEFLNFSKPREAKPQPADLKGLVLEASRALESDIEEKRIDFALEGPAPTVEADPALMRQALFNLLLNAIQAVEPGGRVRAAIVPKTPREVWLEIRDDGPGVAPELREDVFRPYFTTKKQGTGLGLAVVRQIVLAHRWEIDCAPGPDGLWAFRMKGIRLCGA